MKILPFTKTWQNRTVLQFPGGEFFPGKVYAVLGPNGSGKSTFASIVSGILRSDQGAPVIQEGSFSDLSDSAMSGPSLSNPASPDPALSNSRDSQSSQSPGNLSVHEKNRIGFLPQRPYAFHMSLEKNLLMNGEGTKAQKKERARKLMDSLSLTSLSSKSAASLSGGESAKMALARILMKQYSLLLLDEPCASMDIRSIRQTEDLLQEYVKETGCILFLITHSFRQAERLADEVLFLKDGRLLERGDAARVLHDPVSTEVREILDF